MTATTDARAARIARHGGPEVIEWADVVLPDPAAGEVRLRVRAAGLNFIDTYHRSGLYPGPLPSALGLEAAGVIDAVGPGVALSVGQRVATFGPTRGAYATAYIIPADQLFLLPDDITEETAAAVLLKGCTAEFLAERAAHVGRGDAVLVHAAAGGVGQILTAWLTALGARVIATVGSEDKAAAARAAGAAEVIVTAHQDVAEHVRALTDQAGVATIYDGVGADSWAASLASAARRGLIVSYGNASGPVAGVNLGVLSAHGSLFVTRPTLFDYYKTPQERAAGFARLWDMVRSGAVPVTIGQRYPLEAAADAHRDLEARRTRGSTLLIPDG